MNREFQDILNELSRHRKSLLTRTAEGKTYIRLFKPRERLILLGCGHVAQALAEFAPSLDWNVTAVDDRPEFACAERFPKAEKVICSGFVDAVGSLNISREDYVCILTRGHEWDAECLRAVLSGCELPGYLGMIGSRRRAAGLMAVLREEGFAPEILDGIHSPIGLKIGARGPHEIAVSVLAEMIQERRSRKADPGVMQTAETDYAMLEFLAGLDCPCAIMMVLETSGSAPAGAGALMVMAKDGHVFGTVGGGCMEWEAMSAAKNILGTGKSEVISIDLNRENVCGGAMKILVEDLNVH